MLFRSGYNFQLSRSLVAPYVRAMKAVPYLIVDDDKKIRAQLSPFLTQHDLVIADMRPGEDGLRPGRVGFSRLRHHVGSHAPSREHDFHAQNSQMGRLADGGGRSAAARARRDLGAG